jgi:formate hydrogenlyase transcriptional activator
MSGDVQPPVVAGSRLDFEMLISDLSAKLTSASDEAFPEAVEESLGLVVRFFGADRGGILAVDLASHRAHVAHAWYAEHLERVPADLDISGLFPYGYHLLVELGEPFIVTDYDALPPEAAVDRATHAAMGVRSTLNIPITIGPDLRYIMNIEGMVRRIDWPISYIPRLRLLGGIFANEVERRRISDALRQSEARLELATVSAGAGAWNLDGTTGQIWATAAAKALYGFPADQDVTWDQVLEVVHADDVQRVQATVVRTLAEVSEFAEEYRIVLPSGDIRWVYARGRAQRETSGPSRRLLGISLDITARKEAEAAHRMSAARLEAAAETVSLGFYELLDRGSATFVDARCRAMAGIPESYSDGDAIPAFWVEHIHPDDRQPVLDRHEQLNDGRLDRASADYRYLHPQRGLIWLHHVVHVLERHESRAAHRTIGVIQDITDRKLVEEQLTNAHAEVQRLREQLERENIYLRQVVTSRTGSNRIVGQSQAVRRMLEEIERVAPTNSTVLLLGETGTGKELVADAIHSLSRRRDRIMVRINCAAIPVTLIESELFGRERGAYTGALSRQVGRFELADGSTIFLDEIGDLPTDVQAKLLRVLQERQIERLGNPQPIPVDVRVIAATNHHLELDIRGGRFRRDLFYRLNVFPVTVPALRDRPEDVPLLVAALVDELAALMGKRFESVSRESLDRLASYGWPGNVRELRNAIERAMILATGPVLEIEIPGQGQAAVEPASTAPSANGPDRAALLTVLEKTGWRIRGAGGAAEVLGLKPTTLEARLAKLGIKRP